MDRRKARESVSFAVLHSEASRIALSKQNGNAEAHACICNIPIIFKILLRKDILQHHGHLSLLNPLLKHEFCENSGIKG